MNRLEIFVLYRAAETYTKYIDIPSVMNFLNRTGRVNQFSIVAHKGGKAIYIEKLEPATLMKQLNDFLNAP